LANSRDDVTIDNILSHPVGPIPVSMFHEDGTMRKSYESELVKQFENEISLRRSLSANLMEFFTSYRSNTSATVCAFAKHDVNGLQ
jgi:hypothetical protein